MDTVWLVTYLALWVVVLFVGFLLLGVLRSVALLNWRLDQFEATTPRRVGREGLRPGLQAPDFTLQRTDEAQVALHDFSGRKVLLVFVQTGCGPCQEIVPELNRLQRQGEVQVLAVNNGPLEVVRKWSSEAAVEFPVLRQQEWDLSRRYQVYASPFAFLIDEQGVIASKGIINNRQQIGFVLSETRDRTVDEHSGAELPATRAGETADSLSVSRGGLTSAPPSDMRSK